MIISESPERHTFQKEGYVKRCEEQGKLPNPEYIEIYKSWREQEAEQIKDPEWQRNNLEYDLRSTDWILEKARKEDRYAQNIYAALCNNEWMNIKGIDPKSTMDLLKEKFWSCSWRRAGGVVADMLGKGDYIDWYCSGINDGATSYANKFVAEGCITGEIREDFKQLGWVPAPGGDWEKFND
jgi:hypothetical protein